MQHAGSTVVNRERQEGSEGQLHATANCTVSSAWTALPTAAPRRLPMHAAGLEGELEEGGRPLRVDPTANITGKVVATRKGPKRQGRIAGQHTTCSVAASGVLTGMMCAHMDHARGTHALTLCSASAATSFCASSISCCTRHTGVRSDARGTSGGHGRSPNNSVSSHYQHTIYHEITRKPRVPSVCPRPP